MKGRPVAVDAVALVPLVVLPQRVVDAHPIPRGAETRQRGLDRGREQQPIAEYRRNRAGRLERRNELLRRRRTQRLSECPRRPQNPLGQERRVDQRLPLACEIQEVRRRRVDRAGDGAAGEVGVLGALTTLGRLVGGELDPRRDARHQPSKRLEVAHRPPVGLRRLLDRHPRLQRAVREVFQDRIREARHHADPVRAVALCRSGWLPCRGSRHPPRAPRPSSPLPPESHVDSWRELNSQTAIPPTIRVQVTSPARRLKSFSPQRTPSPQRNLCIFLCDLCELRGERLLTRLNVDEPRRRPARP